VGGAEETARRILINCRVGTKTCPPYRLAISNNPKITPGDQYRDMIEKGVRKP
jgi:hypothetical protein